MLQPQMFGVPAPVKEEQVQPGTRWQHHTGRMYRVIMRSNEHSDQQDKFPLTVIYMDEQQKTWSRPVSKFIQKFKPVSG